MVLIGSQALNSLIPLDRTLHDYDLIMTVDEYLEWESKYLSFKVKETDYSILFEINNDIIEIRNPKTLDNTDKILLAMDLPNYRTDFKYGKCSIPDIQMLYSIKKATALCIPEPKHKFDLSKIENQYPEVAKEINFFRQRLQEIQERQSKSKKIKFDFFHKYHIPEYIEHDRFHDMFAELLDLNIATYKRITSADTNISEDLFNKLTHEQKVSLMVEESLVLNMERWFIPQMIERGINYRLIDMFHNNNEAMPTYMILKHVCITGLKGEADYIVNFGREYFFEIEKEWIKAKDKIKVKKGFPQWLFEEIFSLRERYKSGEQIGLH